VNEKVITKQRNKREKFAMKQVMDGEQNVDPSLLPRNDDISSNGNERLRSRPFEQAVSWNPYSEYTAAHYNYYPVPTIAGYPTQQNEQFVAYPNQPDKRYAAYPHPDKQYDAYPQHHYYESSTYPAQIAPPLVYSQPGEYFPYYPSLNEHSRGEWITENHVSGHHSDQFRQNRNSSISNMIQGKCDSHKKAFSTIFSYLTVS
jgi:hypothetical protein